MPTKLQSPTFAPHHARFPSETERVTARTKAAQREFYVLIGVFLGSLTLMCLAVALSAAIMLANAQP